MPFRPKQSLKFLLNKNMDRDIFANQTNESSKAKAHHNFYFSHASVDANQLSSKSSCLRRGAHSYIEN